MTKRLANGQHVKLHGPLDKNEDKPVSGPAFLQALPAFVFIARMAELAGASASGEKTPKENPRC